LTLLTGRGIMMVTERNEIKKQTRFTMTKTDKQKKRATRRKAITVQNNSDRKITMAEAIKEVSNVSNDV
jgi:hypothetical protein